LVSASVGAALLLVVFACSNYGDGERCDSRGANAGNDDCEPGLQCTTGPSRGDPTGTDLCCPPDRATSTSAACRGAKTVIALPDATVEGGSTTDSGGSTDAGNTSDASDAAEGG